MKKIKNIAVIGAGNVATHLVHGLTNAKYNITGIWSRNEKHAIELAHQNGTPVLKDIKELDLEDTELVLICVVDDAIKSTIDQIDESIPVAYTSGSVRLDQLPNRNSIGVFYPLQTFSKERKLKLDNVPFLIESSNDTFGKELSEIASKLSSNVQFANSSDRYQLHIAAVMVNNFSNHLFDLADDHVKEHGLDFSLLLPLIEETVEKLKSLTPKDAQTGPAKRGDKKIINNHLKSLEGATKEVYDLLSQSITNKFKSKQ